MMKVGRKTIKKVSELSKVFPGIVCLCLVLILPLALALPAYAGGADSVSSVKPPIPATKNSSLIKIGEEVYETYETAHPYEGTGIVWEKTFHWPEASYIKIHFADFDLAPGDYVEISSPDGKYEYRYEGKGKVVRGGAAVLSTFWATYIPGDTAIVRLYGTNAEGAWGFTIDKWARGYEPEEVNELLQGDDEAICNEDDKEWAPCYTGKIYDKSKTVARLHIGGTGACTGWLLGSEGHLMTNNHCIETQYWADNTDYEFMGEGATCTTDCSLKWSCSGTIEASSGTLVKTDWALDYSLVLLPTNVTSKYSYLQFRNELPSLDERIYIPQHAGGKGKEIAVNSDTDGPYCKIYSTNEPGCEGRPGPDIGYYADTEGGSSGSPVLAYSDNLVVALHHCANCPNRGVPIPSIISDLGPDLPNDAIGSSEVLDQFQTKTDYGFWFERTVVRWQEFKPTLYDLTKIEIYVSKYGSPGNIIAEIRTVDGLVLGQETIDESSVPLFGWITVDFSNQINLEPGTKYRIYVYSDKDSPNVDNRYFWRGSTKSDYDSDCLNDVIGSWPTYDYAFKTYGTEDIPPVPDIKANGSDGPINIPSGANLKVAVALDSGDSTGVNADWWVLADTSVAGWYYYHLSGAWYPGVVVTAQGPLADLSPYVVLNYSGLSPGTYVFYFGVDTNINGVIDVSDLYYDSVSVTVK